MTGVSTLGQALNRINLLGDQNKLLNALTTQLSTGKKTQEFSGLGNDILTSKRARAGVNSVETYLDNISSADRRMKLMTTGIEEFQAQAKNIWELMIGLGQESLHDDRADIIYGLQTVDGTQNLSGFGSIGALVAANAPELDPPNDSFEVTFSDPDDSSSFVTITVDISDAAAAAGAGNAQIELVNYMNTLLAAVPGGVPAALNANIVALGTGEISFQGTANITISNQNNTTISSAGMSALGLSPGQYELGPEYEIGINNANLDVELATIKDAANDLYDFMVDLLNTEDDGRYLFGGADTLTKPITDTGALTSKVNALLSGWKDGTLPTNASLISAYSARTFSQDPNAITDTTIGYSATLTNGNAGKVFVRVKEQSEIDYTVLANEDPFRDILVALSFIKSDEFTPIADVYAEPYTPGDVPIKEGAPGANLQEMKDNFYAIFNPLTTSVNRAIDEADKARFRVESDRARIDSIKQSYIQQRALYQTTIADVEDADLTDVAVKIQTLQVQLEASYTVTARVSELTLVNFI